MGFPGSSTSKESACKAGELSSAFLALEDPPAGEGKGYQVFWPEEVHGRSPWGCIESDMTELYFT